MGKRYVRRVGKPRFGRMRFYHKRLRKIPPGKHRISSLARMLNVTPATVSYWCRSGLVSQANGPKRVVSRADLLAFLESTGRIIPGRSEY